MKKLIPYLLSMTLLFTGVSAVMAVEKKAKETPPAKQAQPAKTDSAAKASKPAEKKADPKAAPNKVDTKAKTDKKYDNFVDRNNNGVDDRKENLKKKDAK
ncbi:MAG: hypothetical protein IPH75_03395 [bacterium]|nr:hypothetical protein [bacterium]